MSIGIDLRYRRKKPFTFAALAALQLAAASLPAMAADDKNAQVSDKGGLEEVVVTAQFVKQNLQATPISISSVSGDQLEQRSITNIMDVANATPNLLMKEGSSGNGMANAAYIRGIGQGDFLFAYSPKVSFYVDDVYHSTVYGSVFDLMDVDRIEVDRGPQGTLFGRNAVGGAIRIFSKEPTGDNTGYVEVTGGTYERMDVKGAMDLSLVDNTLFARVSMMTHRQDGWVKLDNWACTVNNTAITGLTPTTGTNVAGGCQVGTLGAQDTQAFRGELRWIASESLENLFQVDYTLNHDTASPDTLIAPYQYDTLDRSPGSPGGGNTTTGNGLGVWLATVGGPDNHLPLGTCIAHAFPGGPCASNQPSAALLAALAPTNPYVSYASFGNPGLSRPGAGFADPNINDLTTFGVSDKILWKLTDNTSLKSVTAYRSYSGEFGSSQDSMPFPTQEAFQGVAHHQFSEELTLNGTAFDKAVDWTTGIFYLRTTEWNTGRVQFEGFSLGGAQYVQDFEIHDPATLDNKSAFVHAVWHINDNLNLTAGVRETRETKTYNFFREYSYNCFVFCGSTLVNPGILGGPSGPLPPIATCLATVPGCPDVASLGESNTISRTNPRVALDYKVDSSLMFYTSYATGFTAGGINGRPFSAADIRPYGPEDVKAFELGFKSSFLDNTLRLNGDVFYTLYDNIQVTLSCFLKPGCPDITAPFYVDNGGNAHIKGVELETEYRPFGTGLMITASGGVTDFKYASLNPNAAGLMLSSPQTNVPKYNVNAGIQDEIHLGDRGSLIPRLDANWRSKVYFNATTPNDPLTYQEGYTLVNARLTWRSADPTWQVALAATNLFDKLYYSTKTNGLTGFGSATGTVGAPRMVSLSLRRNF
jgi:iron complex outermembrane receptor protein